jgi:hypothetical protein
MSCSEVTLVFGSCGWYVEWFREDDSAPQGFRSARWYGSREACEARKTLPAPPLRPLTGELCSSLAE